MTKQREKLIDSARQAGAQSTSALEVVESVIYDAEERGLLVRETATLILVALMEYGSKHGMAVTFSEIEQIENLVD